MPVCFECPILNFKGHSVYNLHVVNMITFEQYKLTSVIKLWIADCKSYKMKKMLYRMLYYLYCDQNYVPESEVAALNNIKNSFLSDDFQITTYDCLDNDNITIINDINIADENNAYDSLDTHICQPINKQTKRKSIDEFPEAIRDKIQYYEAKSSYTNLKVNNDKARVSSISNLSEVKQAFICPPPVVVGMILKANIDYQESLIEPVIKPVQCAINQSIVNRSFGKFNSSILSNKDKGNERFLINLFEPPKVTKEHDGKKKISNSSLISMSSKLFIKDFAESSSENKTVQEHSTSAFNNSVNTSLEIMKNIYDQRQIIRQATKAVQTCKKSSYFYNSLQRAEAERILLTASLKRDHFVVQLQNTYQEIRKNTADLTISNIKFPFNPDEIDHQTWFIVTCTTESTFHISSMLELPKKKSCLQLPDLCTFEKVTPDFKIQLCVYELKITDANDKKKMHMVQKLKRSLRRSASEPSLEEKVTSCFRMCGWVDITLDNFKDSFLNLNKNTTKALFSVVHFSGSALSVVLDQKLSGFLTVGFEVNGYLVWDKNWCNLLNSTLHFWSNPSEDSLNSSKMFIDLRNCVMGSCNAMSVRPNTLALESMSDVTAKKYYLSCDSVEDFVSWKSCIKSILETLRHWKTLMYV